MNRPLSQPNLKIDTPTGRLDPGRGFYQLEEDALYVPVGHTEDSDRFFSYLESEHVRFDVAKSGHLMAIEVDFPRRRWIVDSKLTPPTIAEPADVRWLDFRAQMAEPQLLTNDRRTVLLLQFQLSDSCGWFSLAESVLIQSDREDRLTAVMVSAIEDDLAGREIAAFRKSLRVPRTAGDTATRTVDSISG